MKRLLPRTIICFVIGGVIFLFVAFGVHSENQSEHIVLMPQQGKMVCNVHIPELIGQAFALNIPETIGCREKMILNFPEVKIYWGGPDDESGIVETTWTTEGRIRYAVRLIPFKDYVDVQMTIKNLSNSVWHDVFAFNCLNPVGAPLFKDIDLKRTYISQDAKPHLLAETVRPRAKRPLCFYLHKQISSNLEPTFVRGFGATSPNRTDASWIVTLSKEGDAYMAAVSPDAVFLFNNLEFCCIHSATNFGDIGPGEASVVVSRLYFAKGNLEDFLKRCQADLPALSRRQKLAPSDSP